MRAASAGSPTRTSTAKTTLRMPDASGIRPSRAGLIPLASGIRRVVFAVLVLVGDPAEAARIELDLETAHARGADRQVARHVRGPRVPDPQRVRPGRHVLQCEAPVPTRLSVMAGRHHLNERDHAGVDVAEYPHQPGPRERPLLRLATAVLAQVELAGFAHREDVVVEGIVVGEPHRGADGHDHNARHELLVVDGDLGHPGARRPGGPLQPDDGGAEIRRWRVVPSLQQDDPAGDTSAAHLRRVAVTQGPPSPPPPPPPPKPTPP